MEGRADKSHLDLFEAFFPVFPSRKSAYDVLRVTSIFVFFFINRDTSRGKVSNENSRARK